jgi:hypothetical protein
LLYNSSTDTWLSLDGASVPALTGVTSTLITNVSLFKYRLILCEVDSLKFWYGPLNSVGGAFSAFDLGQVFKKGGYLVATASWTVDAGDGADDRFVAITSEGEIAVYQGTDPSNAATFALVGVYEVGKPTGKRCFLKLGGDVGVLTEQGLWPLSKALQSATIDKRLAMTDKIQGAFNAYYNSYGNEFGWQAVLLAKGPAVLVNVPVSSTRSYQFVMNTITGAWCRFTGWNAAAMLVLDGRLFFAVGRTVKEGWTGFDDSNGVITCLAATAFTYGPVKARGKKVTMVRPVMQASSPITFGLALDSNFVTRTALSSSSSLTSGQSLFDSAVYDTSLWADGTVAMNKWKVVSHNPGKSFSLRCQVSVKDIQVTWAATDFIGEAGSILA